MLIKILFLSCVFINFYSYASNCCKDKKSDEQGSSSKSVSPKPPKPTGIRGAGKPIFTSPDTYTPPVKPINNMFSTTFVPISSEVGFSSLRGKVLSDISTENPGGHYRIVNTINSDDSLASVLGAIGITDFTIMQNLLKNGHIMCFFDNNSSSAFYYYVIFFNEEILVENEIDLSKTTKINDYICYCTGFYFSGSSSTAKFSNDAEGTEEEKLKKFFKN